jgi:hypothetical protein
VSEISFTGASGTTGWIDISGNVDDLALAIIFAGTGTIELQVSDMPDESKARYTTIGTYSASTGRLKIPRATGSFLRAIFTAWTSGIGYLHLPRGLDPTGRLYDLATQSTLD